MKINGVYGSVHLEKLKQLVEQQGVDPAKAEPQAAEAGREALIKTVANLTGVTVDHYAEIGLLGFALITDALGGVKVCLKDAVYEPLSGADFPAGWQTLDGPQALSFVRQRHDLPRGDLDRVTRQQAVMASLAHEVISSKTLSSPATLNRLQNAVQRSVVLSDGWDIMDFVEQLQKLAAGSVAFATIPILEEAGWSDDGMQSVVRVDPSQVKEWVASLLHDQDEGKTEQLAYTPDKTTVDVVNDTDVNGLAAAVSQVLTNKGFEAGNVGNNDAGHVTGSQVQAAKADDLGAQAVSKELGGLPVVENASVAPGTIRVVLAGDYTGPGSGLDGSDPTLATVDPAAAGTGRFDRFRAHAVTGPHGRRQRPGVRQLTTLTSALLDPLMAADPVGPRITYYDDATGERIELSTVTLANWAAKTGNLLRDELGAGPGQPRRRAAAAALADRRRVVRNLVDRCGSRADRDADIALCTADRLPDADDAVGAGEVAVLSLDPFGKPAADLPVGVTDYATSVRVHGDQISPERQPGPALDGRSVAEVLAAAEASAAAQGFTRDDRVMSTAGWTTADELTDNLLAVFAAGASLVQVANPDAAALDRRRQMEKVTRG